MGFVGDDGETARFERALLLDGFEHKGESLQRDDDDRRVVGQCCGQLRRLGAAFFADADHDAAFVIELINGFLQLAIEHVAICDHDHRIENARRALGIVQGGQTVREPGDRVAFARTRRMLNQIIVARAFLARGFD